MKNLRFYICRNCGNLIMMVEPSGASIVCCGDEMELLECGAVEASSLKHVPVIMDYDGSVVVQVGSEKHPSLAEHHIDFICIQTLSGMYLKYLDVTDEPKVSFEVSKDEIVCAYAYCNIHGLWKSS